MVCRYNRFVRCSCTAQSVIRQAADVFVSGRFGGSEFWRGADFVAQQKGAPLRNKRCCVAQQRGGWLRKAVGGVS